MGEVLLLLHLSLNPREDRQEKEKHDNNIEKKNDRKVNNK